MAPLARPPPNRVGGLHGIPPKAQRRPRKGKPGNAAPIINCCENPDPQDEDGIKICKNCFTELQNVNITAEVTFEDQAGGRSTVQGGLVGENARFSKTLGAGAYRRIGGGERNSMVEIENAGRRALASLAAPLKVPDNVTQQAASVWSLAAINNFMAGRRTDEVAAACMWVACRRQPQNDVLLMDMAEILRINVFRLGEVYKDLCEKLYLEGKPVGYQHFIEMEPLIKKYCQKLQFGDKTNQVGYDALRIMKRMNRDWIVSGRHPAGLCGACIILAARMNNFQRSVREIVYVSKVADATIAKRVEEFRRTKSAGLTVDEFRKYSLQMLFQHDPPSVYEADWKQQKLQARRDAREEYLRQSQARKSVISIPDDASELSSRASSIALATPPPTQQDTPMLPTSPEQPVIQYAPPVARMVESASRSRSPEEVRKRSSSQLAHSSPDRQAGGIGIPPDSPQKQLPTPDATQATYQSSLASYVVDDEMPASTADDAVDSTDTEPAQEQETSEVSAQQQPSKQGALRIDADGFAIPALPVIDPDLTSNSIAANENSTIPRKRRKKEKQIEPPVVQISQEELADEDYLESQISKFLEEGQVEDASNEVSSLKEQERIEAEAEKAKLRADEHRALEAAQRQQRREAEGFAFGHAPTGETVTAEELEEEFKDDVEVENCLLSATEIQIKERIWVTHNEDWLRKQAEKEMLQLVAKATGFPGQSGKGSRGGGKAGKKKKGKIGDRSVLTEHDSPIESPADAAKAMLDRRAPQKSQHVDFSALQRIYGRTSSASQTPSRDIEGEEGLPDSRARSTAPEDEDRQDQADEGENPPDADRGIDEASPDAERRHRTEVPEHEASHEDDEQDETAAPEYDEEVDDEEDEDEASYLAALNFGSGVPQTDEFGVVDDGYGDEEGFDEYE